MGHHTFDPARADRLEDAAARYAMCSRDELVAAVDPQPTDRLADLGSGTGFYTDDLAPRVDRLYAVDIQPEMHELYREKGVPDNVELVTSGIEELPFDDAQLDGAFSTMTYHEFATSKALAELARVLRSGGRLTIVDWDGAGEGERGPPVDERYTASEAVDALAAAGFDIQTEQSRPETFVVIALAP